MTGGVWPPGSEEYSMRKALIGLILAATAMVPAAANAQRHHNDGDGDRSGWSGRNNGNGGNRGEARAARSEARNEARQQQQQQQVQQPQVQQQQVVERQRGDGGNRGGWNRGGNNGGGERRSWNGGGGDNAGATRGNWNRGGDDGNRRVRTNQQSVYPQAWQGDPNDPRLRHYQELERRNQQGGDRRDWRRDNRNDGRVWRGDNCNDRLRLPRLSPRQSQLEPGLAQRQSLRLAALPLQQPQCLPPRALLFALSRLRLQPLLDRHFPRSVLLRSALLDRRPVAVSPAAGRAGHRMGPLL